MNGVATFQKILKLRTILKSLTQLSWNISQLEKRYPIDALNDEEVQGLYKAYSEYAVWLKEINDELGDELNEDKNITH